MQTSEITWRPTADGPTATYRGVKLQTTYLGCSDLDAQWRLDGSARPGEYYWLADGVACGTAPNVTEAKRAVVAAVDARHSA